MPGKLLKVCSAALVLVTGLAVAGARPALAQELDTKRQQAKALEAQIAAQGDRLSMADEAYNQARLKVEKVASAAAVTRTLADAAEARYGELKSQLAKRVRLLYMHPGAPIDAMLGAKSFAQLERGRVLGASVLTADTSLVLKTEKARKEVLARANELGSLKEQASSNARTLSGRRVAVGRELKAQQGLLENVKGDIAKILDEQRKQELEQAQQAALQQQEPDEPAPTIAPADDSDSPERKKAPDPGDEPAPPPPVSSGAGKAVQTAAAQIGKPYKWAAAGPDSFDCSGLTMYAWNSAGVSMAHSAAAQYNSFPHVSRSELQPGDLVFFGEPIHHVGIYEGGGTMINAPQTGDNVRRDSIARADYVGASRP